MDNLAVQDSLHEVHFEEGHSNKQIKRRSCAIIIPKSLQKAIPNINREAKLKFLKDHIEQHTFHDAVEQKLDLLFEEKLHHALEPFITETLGENNSLEEALAEILLTKNGTLNFGLAPILYEWLEKHQVKDCRFLSNRLHEIERNELLQKEFNEHWKARGDKSDRSLKKKVLTTFLLHHRQESKEDCFAFAVAWIVLNNFPEKMVRDFREIFLYGGLTKNSCFYPLLFSQRETPSLFEGWASILASMAETVNEGIITTAIVNSIIHQTTKFLHSHEQKEKIPKIRKSIVKRIYLGYDPSSFGGKGAFILHDAKNHFERIDDIDKFSRFIVDMTKKWLGDSLNNKEVIHNLLTTFHEDHSSLRMSMSDAKKSRFTPWTCAVGNDPKKVIKNYFEYVTAPPSFKVPIENAKELLRAVQRCTAPWSMDKELLVPVRVVGKHTFTLLTHPIKIKDELLLFADTNWHQNGKDLYLAFSFDHHNDPTGLYETTLQGEIQSKFDESEWLDKEWEFFLPGCFGELQN